jgi:molybdopterin molybdotransferase
MIELETAQQRILSLVSPLPTEPSELYSAAGRVLAEDIRASRDLPGFDNSAMDGYALRAEDISAANPDTPVPLQLVGRALAGQPSVQSIRKGECTRVFTGSALPPGSNAVVMQEDTRLSDHNRELVLMLSSVARGENVRRQGEDVQNGTPLLQAGERLTAVKLGLLAALGISSVKITKAPTVGLLATGSELRDAPAPLEPGQIYESNRTTLSILVRSTNARPVSYPVVADDLKATQSALGLALSECDAVVTTGGVSVGEMDFVKAAFQAQGGELDFWRVAMKPGKPFSLGRFQGKLLFGLPGNPVSAFVTFLLLVRPALLRMQGALEHHLPIRSAQLASTITNDGERRHFVRVKVDPDGLVRPSGPQASHRMFTLATANGLIDVPPHTTLREGERVAALTWE